MRGEVVGVGSGAFASYGVVSTPREAALHASCSAREWSATRTQFRKRGVRTKYRPSSATPNAISPPTAVFQRLPLGCSARQYAGFRRPKGRGECWGCRSETLGRGAFSRSSLRVWSAAWPAPEASLHAEIISVQFECLGFGCPTPAVNFSRVEPDAAAADSQFSSSNQWNHLGQPYATARAVSFPNLINSTGANSE